MVCMFFYNEMSTVRASGITILTHMAIVNRTCFIQGFKAFSAQTLFLITQRSRLTVNFSFAKHAWYFVAR